MKTFETLRRGHLREALHDLRHVDGRVHEGGRRDRRDARGKGLRPLKIPYLSLSRRARVFFQTSVFTRARSSRPHAKGHADFQLGDNVIQKLHVGNFTFYSKSLVYRQQNVYLAEDMFSTSYVSGAGTSFFTCKDDYEAYCSGTARSDAKSIFALLAPYSSREYANPMDLTGHYGGNIAPLQETPEYHYATAPFYQAHWGWRSPPPTPPVAFTSTTESAPPTRWCSR